MLARCFILLVGVCCFPTLECHVKDEIEEDPIGESFFKRSAEAVAATWQSQGYRNQTRHERLRENDKTRELSRNALKQMKAKRSTTTYTRHPTSRAFHLDFANNADPVDGSLLIAAPDVAKFPYSPSPSAPLISREVLIDGNANNKFFLGYPKVDVWRSTGLYARPGKAVVIEVPAYVVGRISVQIGCHSDNLKWQHLPNAKRSPDITKKFAIKRSTQLAANPWGGLIYITVPGGSSLGRFYVRIRNAIKAPHYIHGVTSRSNWELEMLNGYAPWSELETEGVILTVPATSIAKVENVYSLMDMWQGIMREAAAFAGRDVSYRKERIVMDINPAKGGWMHSGYPIVVNIEAAKGIIDRKEILTNGSWGLFHEIGHNYQWSDWTPKGTSEITVNFMSIFLSQKFCGIGGFGSATFYRRMGRIFESQRKLGVRDARVTDEAIILRAIKYAVGGRRFPNSWDEWTGLDTYHILAKSFGWQSFTNVFRTYYSAPLHQPDDGQKYNEWVVRFSGEVGVELCTYFQWWGWPLTIETKLRCRNWPRWEGNPMPEFTAKISRCLQDRKRGFCQFPYIHAYNKGASCCLDNDCIRDVKIKCESPPCQSGAYVPDCDWRSLLNLPNVLSA